MKFEYLSRGTSKFLAKNPTLKKRIEETLLYQAENDWFKCKSASKIHYQSNPVYECRVNSPQTGSVRIAFVAGKDLVQVLYISKTLLKKDFTTEINAFLRSCS